MARILIVDDDAPLRLALAELLRDAGYQVEEASDGRQALHVITVSSPHLVLSDIHMPRLDGLALFHQTQAFLPPLRWILMSGTLRRPGQMPVPFLLKPFDLDVLLELVARSLAD